MKRLIIVFSLSLNFLIAQNSTLDNLSAHVYFLSDDRLEGRGTGSLGEALALEYISNVFKEYGIVPKGENSFVQNFEFKSGKKLGVLNGCIVDGRKLELEKEYFPLNYSGSGSANASLVNLGYGIHAPGLYDDYENKDELKNKVFLINLSSPDGIHPHSKYLQYTDYQTRIKTAEAFGAAGVIFYNVDENLDDPSFDLSMKVKEFEIPVIFVKGGDIRNALSVKISVDLYQDEKVGHNVIGFIDNNASSTVVLGAHYDHLGWGEEGNSLYRGEPAIHNGADDNASGVSLLLELAKSIKEEGLKNNNYLFIAFSGEELGLYGSKSFIQNATIDTSEINYMLNFDMVGRLDEEGAMAVNGVGTAKIFKELVEGIKEGEIKVKTTESGMGPSDHASFYLANIPVLHFYTGNNPDYHKPSDDAWLINYPGMYRVYEYTMALLRDLDDEGELEFVKTKDTDNKNAPKFSVTLGVVPDYMYDGLGMRIDGVTEGKPASIAGMKTGDIVVFLGQIEITDMMAYMTALSKFQKGDRTTAVVMRDGKELKLEVEF
ncbi:MAG: M20/M25/M40 family metallo-hydrolase [Chitinophagales bacterium]|nr:M20/M25/M40 family metallo-hydrolase [Chitinophagales bacterium]